ncbi:hypothetical protein [Streptomyces avermitilis]|uniref:hypothetical protein n=1 Tax=Streptomyces avermitilis TaxID=33903 RepID=UPI0033BC44DB
MKFTQGSDGAWLLSSDKADTAGGPTPTTQVSDTDAEATTDDGGGAPDEDEGGKDEAADTTPLPGSGASDTGKPAVSAAYKETGIPANRHFPEIPAPHSRWISPLPWAPQPGRRRPRAHPRPRPRPRPSGAL